MAFRNKRRTSAPIPKKMRSKLVVISTAKPANAIGTDTANQVIRDEAAYLRNNQKLHREYSTKTPNTSVMVQLLNETHSERRKQFVTSTDTVTALLKTFPFFMNQKWVSR